MKIRKIAFIIIAVVAVLLLSACDYIFPLPLGRDNPVDSGVQIRGFTSAVSGDSSITVVWDWHTPAPDVPDDQIIDKIRIVHNENDYPSSMYPLRKDDYVDKSDPSVWQLDWKGLKKDRDHYFALYAHEKGGTWLAPKIVKQNINSGGWEEHSNRWFEKLYVDTSAASNTVFVPAGSDFVHDVPRTIFFLVFDFSSEEGAVLDARLTSFGVNNTGTVDVVPVRRRINNGMQWGEINNPNIYDYSKAFHVYISGNSDELQIKDQVNVARMYGSNTVAVIPDPGSPINTTVDASEFYNGIDDLFSIWRLW